jgi:hypothetical protein
MKGDLLNLLFVAAFILFGLLGGRKKKRPPTPIPRQRARPDPRMGADRLPAGRPAPRAGRPEQDRLLRELESLLTGRPARSETAPPPAYGSMQDLPDPDEARTFETLEADETSSWEGGKARAADVTDVWQAGEARAAETLETLEAAGGASHKRFHALYDRPQEVAKPRRPRPSFPTAEMRRAFIWSEILGPPVSER